MKSIYNFGIYCYKQLVALSEGRGMYPQITSLRIGMPGEVIEDSFLSLSQFPGLDISYSGECD